MPRATVVPLVKGIICERCFDTRNILHADKRVLCIVSRLFSESRPVSVAVIVSGN